MKVIESDENEDRYGRYPIVFSGFRSLEEINEYLFQHYQGYHFCIMFNETKDEYCPYGNKAYVYFSDEALEEIAFYAGKKVVNDGTRN